MSEHKNFVKMTVSGTPGTGTITLGSASTGYQSFASAYGADATVDVSIVDGTAWEVARDCTYTNSGTTLTRGTLEASSTGSALSLTSAAVVTVTATADFGRRMESAALSHVAGADSNTTMVLGSLYVIDGATLTADRTYTLPATAAVGDRIGVLMSAGSASYEVLLTAASGDTLNGIAGGTEWSRLFITGEVVIMRCVAANATWVVEQDGRIPQRGLLRLSTAPSANEAAATFVYPTAATPTAGVWTVELNVGSCCVAASDRITARRAGDYAMLSGALSANNVTDQKYFGAIIEKNGSTTLYGNTMRNPVTVALRAFSVGPVAHPLAADDYIRFKYRSEEGSKGLSAASTFDTYLSMTEVL